MISHVAGRQINVLLQCTTKELPYILRLIRTLPSPFRAKRSKKAKFIICSDIKFTEYEKNLICLACSQNIYFNNSFDVCIESVRQDARTSIYLRKFVSPGQNLKYGCKHGPNHGFFNSLKIASTYSAGSNALTLLLESDCIIYNSYWLESLLKEYYANPGKIIYGAKPKIENLPAIWTEKFKKQFITNLGNRYNGVAIYDTCHAKFSRLVRLWAELLEEVIIKIDPVLAFDLLPASLTNYQINGKIQLLSSIASADEYLSLYYEKSVETNNIVDCSAFDFAKNIDRLQAFLNNPDISILHSKISQSVDETLNSFHSRSDKSIVFSLSSFLPASPSPSSSLPSVDAVAKIDSHYDKNDQYFLDLLLGYNKSIKSSSLSLYQSISKIKADPDFEPRYLFTIITVNFNNGEGLKKTIESVRNQLYPNYQYIVIDGDSDDNSIKILEDYCKCINIAVSEKDEGVYNAMNKGLDLSLGKYILFLNSGDCFVDEKVLSNVAANVCNHDPKIIYGNTRFQQNKKIWPANTNPLDVWKGMVCSHQSIFIDHALALKYRFDESLKIVADWNMIMSCIFENKKDCMVLDFAVSEIEPVGISSDFTTRTLERWNLIHKKFSHDNQFVQEIDQYYLNLVNNHSKAPGSISSSTTTLPQKIDSRLIFLISMPRSGSTLLQRILESSREVGSCGESWVALPPIAGKNPHISNAKYEIKLANHAFEAASQELSLDKNIMKDAEYAYLEKIYSGIVRSLKSTYFLDKTPRYVHIIDELYSLFPTAKFVVLLRQPSAIINSYASTWCSKNYKTLFDHPSYRFDFAHGFPKLIKFIQSKKSNVLTVTYEKLCENPSVVAQDLSDFLGFPVTPQIARNEKTVNRKLGDPKQINHSSQINSLSVSNLGKQSDFSCLDYYDKICSLIPSRTWNYFKGRPDSALLFEQSSSTHTIVITSFNNQSTIVSAISSAVNQSLKPSEIIVVDDCSEDQSISVINNYIESAGLPVPVKLICNQQNLGVSSSRHKAISESSTEFISTLDGDDTISPFKIQKEMEAIDKFKCEVAISDIKLLTINGAQILNTRGYHQKSVESILNGLLSRSIPVPRDLTFSRNIYNKSGGFEPSFNLFEDWMLKQRLAVFAGEQSWAHSGVVGTTYDRRNPGLSNKTPTQLMYAQLLVLAKNIDLLADFDIDFVSVMLMLANVDKSSPLSLERFHQESESKSSSLNNQIFTCLNRMRLSMDTLPSYLSDDNRINIILEELLISL